jgi:cation:H+ antiporter
LGYYIAYTVYLYLQATQHSALEPFSTIMRLFVIPLTVITLIVVLVREIQIKHREAVAASNPIETG